MTTPPAAHSAIENPYFQVGVLVEDIEAAREELGRALGVTWGDIVERQNGDWNIRVCFALEGPPYLELIEGPPGSPWEAVGGSRIDHIGCWTPDIEASKQQLADDGFALELDGARFGGKFSYHRGPKSGLRVELLESTGKDAFYERWGLEKPSA
jgi:Glyoxalase/Bleomycin resistance protein/Dioxygenase superfamily